VALLTARGRRRRDEAMVVVWGAPVGAAMLGAGALVATRGGPAVAPVVALLVGGVLLAWCGSTPWRSRVLSPRLGAVSGHRRSLVLCGLVAIGAGAAVVAALSRGDVEAVAVVIATGSAAAALAMATGAAFQWRFVPRSRARDASVLVVASVCVVGYPVVASTGAWWSPAPLLAPLVAAFLVGRGPVARSDAAAIAREPHEEERV
jgi:hypothetical protein